MIELVEKKDLETLKHTLQNVMANNVSLELRIKNMENEIKTLYKRVVNLESEVRASKNPVYGPVPSYPTWPTPVAPVPNAPYVNPNTIWCKSEYKYSDKTSA